MYAHSSIHLTSSYPTLSLASSYYYMCVLILLYMFLILLYMFLILLYMFLILLYMCPHTTVYCVLILLYICPHTTVYVPHTTIYVSSYYYILCPHTTIYMSSYYCICVLVLGALALRAEGRGVAGAWCPISVYISPHATICVYIPSLPLNI